MPSRTFKGPSADWFDLNAWLEVLVPTSFDSVVVNGVAQVRNASAFASSVVVNPARALTVNAAGVLTIGTSLRLAADVSNGAKLVVNGGGQVTVGGGGTGPISIENNARAILGGETTPVAFGTGVFAGAIAINAGGRLEVNATDDVRLSSPISGAGIVAQKGAGTTLTVTGANTLSGGWTIAAGATLKVGEGGAAGSLGTASVTNDGTLTFDKSGPNLVELLPNIISNAGEVNFLGNAEYQLLAANSYTGRTTIGASARLDLGNVTTDGSLGSGDIVNQGVLALGRTGGNFLLTNAISGSGEVFKFGANQMTLSGANSYSGGTFVGQGTLTAARINAFGSGDLEIAGVADVSGLDQSIGALLGNGLLLNNSGGDATLTLNVAGTASFTGQIDTAAQLRTLTLVKNGIGDQTISGGVDGLKRVIVNQGTFIFGSNSAAFAPQSIAFGAGARATIAFGAGVTQGAPISGIASGDTLRFDGLPDPTQGTNLVLVSNVAGVQRWGLKVGNTVRNTFDLVGSYNNKEFVVSGAGAGRYSFFSIAARGANFKGSLTSDVLWFNTGSGLALDWEMFDGAVSSSNNPIAGFTPGSGWSLIGRADITGDLTTDVLLSFTGGGQTTIAAWQVANGTFAADKTLGGFASNSGWAYVGKGDFDFDGTDDILLSFTAGGNVSLYDWRVVNGAVQTTVNLNMGFSVASDWSVLGTGDFNGDGTADILFQNAASGLVADWAVVNGAAGAFTSIAGVAPNTGWTLGGIGDFDGDGTSDVIWQNGATLAIWNIANGALKQQTTMGAVRPFGFALKAVGDYYSSGVSGLLWQDPASGAIQVWRIENDQLAQTTTIAGPAAGSGWGIVG